MAWPYPNPMRMLPALLYTLAKEVQYTAGRVAATTTEDWYGRDATLIGGTYWYLPVDSTLGFPDTGYLKVLGRRWYYGGKDEEGFYMLASNEPPEWLLVPLGTVLLLEVTS